MPKKLQIAPPGELIWETLKVLSGNVISGEYDLRRHAKKDNAQNTALDLLRDTGLSMTENECETY